MTVSRRDDLACSILLITSVPLYASMGADPLYKGIGYLIAVPVMALGAVKQGWRGEVVRTGLRKTRFSRVGSIQPLIVIA
jgi:hypothetical protein